MLRSLRILLSTTKHLPSRCCSGFVSRTRYVNWLKEDDEACLAALQNGHIFLFHHLRPLLQRTKTGTLRPAALITSDLQSVLEQLGSDRSLMKDSVLIGCSEQNQAQFCLDVGELDQAAVEEECTGNFMDLGKSLFLLTGEEVPLLAKWYTVHNRDGITFLQIHGATLNSNIDQQTTQGQALLRWHQTSRFCSATGQLTQRNQAGSQRVCSSNGIVYYPKMSPVVIVLVSDGKRCLLGRQSSFPRGMYSALAGFCDMGESLEEALCREVAEEVGLEVQSVSYSSSQHWPFPHSSFMLGCHATISPAHTQLQVDHAELEDARWFSAEEIKSALKAKTPPQRGDPPILWLPPKQAIAHRLITEWMEQQQLTSGI